MDDYNGYYDDDPDYIADVDEWRPGQCDGCSGIVTDAPLTPVTPVCACAIGQGAPLAECQCGPAEAA